ncbi:hypothetical protein FRB94_000816 [Tulasnella sp. JGI-2019a]|nr:hypothetical protein FRB94_000816 [Tulasnella sp. JGI-2019a]KAG9014523.1 hypothetical protein FRB93_013648 [Tulasnella sp. JGI-2019a]KAG9039778.1 hypothetical protein FRB95_007205 [Tulasnella sp. JGI-2019a]
MPSVISWMRGLRGGAKRRSQITETTTPIASSQETLSLNRVVSSASTLVDGRQASSRTPARTPRVISPREDYERVKRATNMLYHSGENKNGPVLHRGNASADRTALEVLVCL